MVNFTISFLRDFYINIIEMYSTYNERKFVVAEGYVAERTLKNKIFKYTAAILKSVYFDVLDDIVNKYNKTVHRTIKMKPIEVTLVLMLNTMKILVKNNLNLKLVIMSGYQNTNTFLLKDIPKIVQKKLLLLVK